METMATSIGKMMRSRIDDDKEGDVTGDRDEIMVLMMIFVTLLSFYHSRRALSFGHHEGLLCPITGSSCRSAAVDPSRRYGG